MDLYDAIEAVLAGDAGVIDEVERIPHNWLHEAAGSGPLLVTADAVCRVLTTYAAGEVSKDQAQRWAAMIFWGHHERASLPLRGLPFDYDEDGDQDAIAEAILRLEQLGDLIDGEISVDENARLRAALIAQAPSGLSL